MKPPIIPPRAAEYMPRIFANYPELTEVILFGSRATGVASERSDIDIAVRGLADYRRLDSLILDLEEDIPIAQKWDVKSYEEITYAPLKRHIDEYGIIIYKKPYNNIIIKV